MEAISRSQDRLSPECSEILFKRHLQGALVRSGASLIMGLFAVIAFYTGTIKFHHLAAVGFSILFLILINPPTLWILKRIESRLVYRYFSLLINLLEIIGYTGIIYSLGGIEATYLTPIYAALVTYVGVVSPRSFPFIIAALCALAFSSMVTLEYFGYLPHQWVVSDFRPPLATQMVYALVVMGLLFVTAYISHFTGSVLRRAKDKLQRKNIELQTAVSRMEDVERELLIAHGELEKRVEERTRDLAKVNKDLEVEIVERKQAEEAMRDSEEKYRTILEKIEDGYYEVDLTGTLTFFNDSACKITGYSEHELMGMNNREYTDEENARKLYTEYNKVYETGIPTKRLEWEIIRQDGKKRFIETSISLIRSSEGQSVGFRGILRDVTDRKELEHEIMEKSRLAEEASKAKGEFLANMSHEIRTPLNGIIGMAELALDTKIDDNQKNIFHTINTEASSLQDVINEILDFSKIEAGKVDIEEVPFDLRHAIEDVANSFAHRAEQQGLDFISFLAPDVPSQLIGDPARLRQIVVNLMGNALKFTHKGEIYLKGELIEEIEDCAKIRFSVKDTGIGIPEDRQTTIFESFSQADGSTTRRYGGTGLGTTISKQLAEMMGGEIGVESKEGKGSTFWFTALFGKQEGKNQISATPEFDLKNLKVLVVDNNQTNRFILMEYLKSWGCLSTEVAGGRKALTVLSDADSSKSPFDLILTDFQMPEMSGFDLAKKIKTIDTLKDVPIIVLTSAGKKGDGRNCKEIGINGYLTKPIRQNEMRKAIVSVLGLSTGRKTGSLPELVTRHSVTEDYRKEVQILLVEDYPTNQKVAMRHLSRAGYQVDLAEDGSQAVKAYMRKSYDLAFMDIQMPIMDGYAATREIRKIEARNLGQSSIQRFPIIAMTAHAIKGYREKCLEAGMDDYIAKPIKRKELLAMAEKWTGGD